MIRFSSYLIAMLLLFACNEPRDSNSLIVGTSADNPPYEFIINGEIVGIDADIVKELARQMNREVSIKNMDFQSLLAALASGKIDMIAAGMSVTEERKKQVAFSNTYSSAKVAVLVKNNKDIKSESDLKDVKIGVQAGTFWHQVANKISSSWEQNVKTLTNNLTLVQELLNETVDVVIMEEYQAKKFMERYHDLRSFTLGDYSSEFAFVLPKSTLMLQEVNSAINALDEKGIIKAIENNWLYNKK